MHRILLTAFLLLSFIGLSVAQDVTLSGVITDKETNDPLVGASVVTKDGKGVTTDLDGKYSIKLPKGKYQITYSFIGYEPKVKEIDLTSGAPVKKDVSLGMTSEQLDIVVVSASQYQKSIAEETVSMEVVSKALIQNTNATDLGEAIDKTPGVTIQDSQVSIRGGSSWSYGVGTRTAVMQDGMSMMSADLGEPQLRQAPLENVEQIEVIKGASSVVYGSSALNGVVNVITAWPKSAEPITTVTVFQKFYDNPPDLYSDQTYTSKVDSAGVLVDTLVHYPADTLKWWDDGEVRGASGINFNHARKIRNIDLIVGGNVFHHKSFLSYADEFRAGLNFKTRIHNKRRPGMNYGVNGNFVYEQSGRFFLAVNPNEGALQSAVPSSDRYFRANVDPHFHYTNDKGFKHSLETRYMYIMRISGNTATTPHAISSQIMLNYQFQKLWKKWSITTGLPTNVGISSSNLYTGLRISYSTAIYAQGEFKTKRLSAVAGIRYEVLGVDDFTETSTPVFRTGLNYQVGKATFLRGSFGQSYRLPTIAERYLSDDLNGIVQVIPNRELVAEKGLSAELGLKQAVKISKWVAYLDFAVFYQQYKELVEYGFVSRADQDSLFVGVPNNIFIGLYPQNVSNALVAGYEVGVASQGKIGPIGINALIGYTYNYPINLDSAKNYGGEEYLSEFFEYMVDRIDEDNPDAEKLLKLRPRHLVKGDIQLSYKKATVGLTIVYGSSPENLPLTERNAVDFLSGEIANESTGELGASGRYYRDHEKGDLVFNLRASYQVLKQLKVSFIVNNLTNRIYAFRPSKVEPIRNFTLQLSATF
ncbi:MAG: TonB-dependent receptor [Flavobacteriales bacterium]|nr:TonB-dependent receptor [Flavobacteriales bacterium]MCB9190223.1 TonB-dependent receptor [Flavobacteriales bacterium]MCB9205623.1 TonB-dependent receptor [Flavobacteriales bacterium]